jgi:hypothetical protein
VALKLSMHQMVCMDVGKRLKKVRRSSPVCGRSYGRWRDRTEGRHGLIVLFVLCERCVVWIVAWSMNECMVTPDQHSVCCCE